MPFHSKEELARLGCRPFYGFDNTVGRYGTTRQLARQSIDCLMVGAVHRSFEIIGNLHENRARRYDNAVLCVPVVYPTVLDIGAHKCGDVGVKSAAESYVDDL